MKVKKIKPTLKECFHIAILLTLKLFFFFHTNKSSKDNLRDKGSQYLRNNNFQTILTNRPKLKAPIIIYNNEDDALLDLMVKSLLIILKNLNNQF